MTKAAFQVFMCFSGIVLIGQGPVWSKDFDKGKIEYQSKCATCHGYDGKGNGPFASQIKTVPPDLTLLAKRNGGVFPQSSVAAKIDGRKDVEAHGPRDMPIWGYRYPPGEEAGRKTRLDALVDYLQRIQEK